MLDMTKALAAMPRCPHCAAPVGYSGHYCVTLSVALQSLMIPWDRMNYETAKAEIEEAEARWKRSVQRRK